MHSCRSTDICRKEVGEQDVPYSRQTFGSVFTVLLISLQFCDVTLPNYPRICLRSCALPSLACSPRDAKFLPQQLLLKLFLNRLWRPVFETFHLQTLQNHNQCQIIFFWQLVAAHSLINSWTQWFCASWVLKAWTASDYPTQQTPWQLHLAASNHTDGHGRTGIRMNN